MLGRISTGSDPMGSNLIRGEFSEGRISFGVDHMGSNHMGANPVGVESCMGRIPWVEYHLGPITRGSNPVGRIPWVELQLGRIARPPVRNVEISSIEISEINFSFQLKLSIAIG